VPPPILRTQIAEIPEVSASLARAFQQEDLIAWLVPEVQLRATFLSRLFRLLVEQHVPDGDVFHDEAHSGAVIARSSTVQLDQRIDDFADLRASLSERSRQRLDHVDHLVRLARPHWEHYYFAFCGVLPTAAGTGLGTALIQACLSTEAAQRLPGYAEASNMAGVTLMCRNGFTVAESMPISPTLGLALHPLHRA